MELTFMDVQTLQIWKKFARSKSKLSALSVTPLQGSHCAFIQRVENLALGPTI
jgi:hypothetical protein